MKGKLIISNTIKVPVGTLIEPVGEHVRKNPDIVPASQHRQSFQIVCLVPLFTPGVHKDLVFDTASKFFWGSLLSSLGIKESKAPGFFEPAAV